MESPYEFDPISPFINISFWIEFFKAKLEKFKLSQNELNIFGTYTIPYSKNAKSIFNITGDSISHSSNKSVGGLLNFKIGGMILNYNIESDFLSDEKSEKIFIEEFKNLYSNQSQNDPYEFNKFFIFSFADLKQHVSNFCIGIPQIKLGPIKIIQAQNIIQYFTSEKVF